MGESYSNFYGELFFCTILIFGISYLFFKTTSVSSKSNYLVKIIYWFSVLSFYFIIISFFVLGYSDPKPVFIGLQNQDKEKLEETALYLIITVITLWALYAIFKETNLIQSFKNIKLPESRKTIIQKISETKHLYEIGVYSKEEYEEILAKLKNRLKSM
jgi:magnesium-transporting ATPase (P-type)